MQDSIKPRDFLKYAGAAGAVGLWPGRLGASEAPLGSFAQQVDHVGLYMTHYALFEEPDPRVLPGIYLDAATGMPTGDLTLTLPRESFGFVRTGPNPTEYVSASSGPVKQMPYVVKPPGFPALPAPPAVVGAIQQVLGGALPASDIASNAGPSRR